MLYNRSLPGLLLTSKLSESEILLIGLTCIILAKIHNSPHNLSFVFDELLYSEALSESDQMSSRPRLAILIFLNFYIVHVSDFFW